MWECLNQKKIHKMTDPVQSGGNAPAADTSTPAPDGGNAPQFGTFSNRGSGLARGKRNTVPTAGSSQAAPSGDYKPTALEVIVPQREYKNPFGDPAPVAETPAPATVEAAAIQEVPSQPAPVAPAVVPAAPAPQAEQAPAVVPAKPVLNILPQAETKRPAVSWERGPSAASRDNAPSYPARSPREDSHDDRPVFRPEPRGDAVADAREPRPEAREPRPEAREPRPEAREFRREHDERRPAHVPQPAKPRGFFAWLKGLFRGKPAPQPGPDARREERQGDRGFQRDGGHRRRRRGGRGRNFSDRGGDPRGQPQGGEPRFQGEGRHGDDQGGNRPRRHRGGRGRGDNRGGPRSEGQQGGGAI